MIRKSKHLIITALISAQATLPAIAAEAELANPVIASLPPSQAAKEVDDLAKQILLKEIELQRFNLHYTLEVAKQGRWKGWRYASAQEVNTGMNLAGGIISTVNRGTNLHHASKVQLYPQEAANYIPMIGSIIGASAAVTEFSINGFHDFRARRHGFSPAASIKKVGQLKSEILQLLQRRDELIKIEASDTAYANHVAIDKAEGDVLKDTLDQSLQEFARYHIGARKLLAFQQAQFIFDASKYITSAIGSEFAYLSLSRGQRIWNGRAGILFVVSGQLTMLGPVLSRAFAKGVGTVTRHRLAGVMRDAQDADIATLQKDLRVLNALMKQGNLEDQEVAAATNRQAMLDTHEKAFVNEIRIQENKNAAAKLTATQNIAAGAFVGASKTASGILFILPGFNPAFNRKTQRASRTTNDLLFASAVIGLPANTFSMIDTLRIQIKGELNRRKAAKAGQLPAQLAKTRLQELDDIEQRLQAL
jgi:hypothetical protein